MENKQKMRRFTVDETHYFLDLYASEECLWNTPSDDKSSTKKNVCSIKKNEAWKRIADAMNIEDFNESCVRKKYKSLRLTYFQEMKKVAKSRETENSTRWYVSNISWLSKMEKMVKKPSEANNSPVQNDVSTTCDNEIENISVDSLNIKCEPEDFEESESEMFPCEKLSQEENPYKRKRSEIDSDEIEYKIQTQNSTSKETELDLFGKYITAELKTLKPKTRLYLQKDIINMTLESKIKDIF